MRIRSPGGRDSRPYERSFRAQGQMLLSPVFPRGHVIPRSAQNHTLYTWPPASQSASWRAASTMGDLAVFGAAMSAAFPA